MSAMLPRVRARLHRSRSRTRTRCTLDRCSCASRVPHSNPPAQSSSHTWTGTDRTRSAPAGAGLRGGGSPWQARSRADLLGQVSWSGCDRSIASPSASTILAAAAAVRGVPTIGATATSVSWAWSSVTPAAAAGPR
jgi:hypothetical protein